MRPPEALLPLPLRPLASRAPARGEGRVLGREVASQGVESPLTSHAREAFPGHHTAEREFLMRSQVGEGVGLGGRSRPGPQSPALHGTFRTQDLQAVEG